MISLMSKIVIYVLIVADSTLLLLSRRKWYILYFALFGTLCGFVIETLGVNLNLWNYGQEIAILGVPPVIYVGWFFTMFMNGLIVFFILNRCLDKSPLKSIIKFEKNSDNKLKNPDFKLIKGIFIYRYKEFTISLIITWIIGCLIEFYGVNQKIWAYVPLGSEILNVPIIVLISWGIVMFICILFFYFIIEKRLKISN